MSIISASSLRLVLGQTLARYVGASAVALGADLGCYLVLLRCGMAPVAASALAYGAGVVVHWWLSSRGVFPTALAQAGIWRLRQKVLFVGTALIGLAVTGLVVGVGSALGLDPRLSKLVAVAAAFLVTYVLRHRLVFAVRMED